MTLPPREITIEFDGKSLSALQYGDPDGKPVLALHGWLDNCASFYRLAPLLEGVNLVTIDMAGHGRSYHRARQAHYNIWEEVEDVLGATQALGWHSFSLLGHSRGAVISLLTAGAFPGRVERMALIDGLVPPSSQDVEAPEILCKGIAQRALYAARKPTKYPSLDAAIKARMNGLFPISEAAARALAGRAVHPVGDGYCWNNDQRLMASSTVKLNDTQVEAFMDRATMPVRLVLAEKGIVHILERIRPLLKEHTNIEVRKLPGGHHLHMEEGAEGIAEWFAPFLRGEAG